MITFRLVLMYRWRKWPNCGRKSNPVFGPEPEGPTLPGSGLSASFRCLPDHLLEDTCYSEQIPVRLGKAGHPERLGELEVWNFHVNGGSTHSPPWRTPARSLPSALRRVQLTYLALPTEQPQGHSLRGFQIPQFLVYMFDEWKKNIYGMVSAQE